MGGRRECTPRAAFQGRIASQAEPDRATNSIPRRFFARITHATAPTATPQRLPMTRQRPIRTIAQTPRNQPQNHSHSPKSTQCPCQLKAGFALGENFITPVPHDHHRPSILANFRRKSAVLSHFPLQGQAKHTSAMITLRDPFDQCGTKPAADIVKQGPAHAENLTR